MSEKTKNRKEAVRVLYSIGLTIDQIAGAIGFSTSTIANDLTALGGSKVFNHSSKSMTGFEKRLNLFSKIFLSRSKKLSNDWWISYFNTNPSVDLIDMVWQGINKEISLNKLYFILKGSWRTIQWFSQRILKYGTNVKFLSALYGNHIMCDGIGDGWKCDTNTTRRESQFIQEFLVETLEGFSFHEISTTCVNFEELISALVSIFSEYVLKPNYQNSFMYIFTTFPMK